MAQGLDCDGGDCGFAPNAALRFKFDRWLIPTTATRQSVALGTEGTHLGVFLHPDYDVTARVLTLRPDTPLAADTAYILNLTAAGDDPNGNGLRAYDGRGLEKSQALVFRTTMRAAEPAPESPIVAGNCSEIVAAFAQAGCTALSCHGSHEPRMGLALDGTSGLKATAINHVAHETQSGTEITERVVSGGRFGTQMPIIDPGRPENSYLMYKLLISDALNREMDARASDGDAFASTGLTASQIDDARAWFIELSPMPPDEIGYARASSPLDFVTRVQQWIRAGAVCP